MLFIPILLHVLGNYAPKWIWKKYYLQQRKEYSWKYSLFQLSGLAITFIFTVIFVSIATLNSTDRFIENKNAIYGLEFGKTLKSIGFEDGDKILSINDNNLGRVSNIMGELLLTDGEVRVIIENKGKRKELRISDSAKIAIMESASFGSLKPIMHPTTQLKGDFEKVQISEVKKSFSHIPATFGFMWNQVTRLLFPVQGQVGGFNSMPEVVNLLGYFTLLSFYTMFIGIINFLPFPGFSFGNVGLTIIEKSRRKHFSKRTLYGLQFLSIIMAILLIIISVYR